jgi:anti-sigma factor RsiW
MTPEGQMIPLHGDGHEDLQDLLPWYANGQLDASDRTRVEAHLTTCPDCQAEVRFQRQLRDQIASLPMEVEHGWSAMLRRLDDDAPARPSSPGAAGWRGRIPSGLGLGAPWLGWAAASAAMLLAAVAWLPARTPPARYHALGAPPPVATGNVVVIFRPDTTEQALRMTLNANRARLVDGPTAADAYVLHVAPAERPAVLARLRSQPNILLAEPLDGGAAR